MDHNEVKASEALALEKGMELVREAMGHRKATSPQSEADLTRNANTERVIEGRQAPVFLNELATRRDLFAAAALTGMLANGTHEHIPLKVYALDAWEWADAMLETREE